MMLKNNLPNKVWLTLLLTAGALAASAQKTFKYQAGVDRVDTPGFYAITLNPALIAKSNSNLADLRILDDSGRFVPYVRYSGSLVNDDAALHSAFMVMNTQAPADTGTALVVENTSQSPVDNLSLKLKNAAVQRTVNLYGSDDLKKWFAIKENVPLEESKNSNGVDYIQTLNFPASNYHYLKLLVNDKNKAPINFLQAGTWVYRPQPISYSLIPGVKFVKKDSGRFSIVTINPGDNYLVEKLKIQVKSPRFYNRSVEIYSIDGATRTLLSAGELRSDSDATPMVAAKAARLELRIANEDNPPLDIQNITLYQPTEWLTAYLEKGRKYKILTGDSAATEPVYDLKFFSDSVRKHLLHVNAGTLTDNVLYTSALPPASKKSNQTLIIWLAIIAALALLLALTWKMMGEIRKRETGQPEK